LGSFTGGGAQADRAVLVDDEQGLRHLIAVLAAPDLGPAEEEPLVAGEAVEHRGRFAAE